MRQIGKKVRLRKARKIGVCGHAFAGAFGEVRFVAFSQGLAVPLLVFFAVTGENFLSTVAT